MTRRPTLKRGDVLTRDDIAYTLTDRAPGSGTWWACTPTTSDEADTAWVSLRIQHGRITYVHPVTWSQQRRALQLLAQTATTHRGDGVAARRQALHRVAARALQSAGPEPSTDPAPAAPPASLALSALSVPIRPPLSASELARRSGYAVTPSGGPDA